MSGVGSDRPGLGDQAVAIADESDYGLPGAVFGPPGQATEIAFRVRAGSQTVDTAIDFDFDAPYGGFKMSGTGRELGGIEGIISFTESLTLGI
jgi:acyl-CoA reductase-like NAD-dependent aldehyde dehydrogenase